VRRHYPSVSAVLHDYPSTTLLVNCTGLGSLKLSDINDTNLYPTRGQTLLVAEPRTPITRMYEMERVKYDNAILLASSHQTACYATTLLTSQLGISAPPSELIPRLRMSSPARWAAASFWVAVDRTIFGVKSGMRNLDRTS
jgi:hypothetical protein